MTTGKSTGRRVFVAESFDAGRDKAGGNLVTRAAASACGAGRGKLNGAKRVEGPHGH